MLRRFAVVFALLSLVFSLTHAQVTPKSPPSVSSYDVIVVGSEPEGIMTAVAAAESGAKTLLITEDAILGGLFVLGEMNSLDLRSTPVLYQQGLFERWWQAVGRGYSFDVGRAEQTFVAMLRDAGVTVRTAAPKLVPVVQDKLVIGVRVAGGSNMAGGVIHAPQVVDATADMTFGAAAGVGYHVGFGAVGYPERMADTLVFRIDGVDWDALQAGVRARGRGYASVDDWVACGHFGGYPAAYQPNEEGLRLRGLNLGRQEDGSVLVNALLIYGIDPFDPASLAEWKARAEREAPRVIEYLAKELPGFENAYFGGVAQSLYIRETRHLDALCTLSVDDVLNNRVTPEDVAAGGYPLDVQTLTPFDSGYVLGTPYIYGVRLCSAVPRELDGLWVVGKAAGYDPLAASSARVVPFGMALGEAVGVAAALAAERNLTPAQFAVASEQISELRGVLEARGAYLPPLEPRDPVGPHAHPHYPDYRLMLSRGLAVGGYDNTPQLDAPMSSLSYVYLLSNVGERFLDTSELGKTLLTRYSRRGEPLSQQQALEITRDAACELGVCVEATWDALTTAGLAPASFMPGEVLTRGEMYTLAAGIARLQPVAESP